jgi:hypothetical protein
MAWQLKTAATRRNGVGICNAAASAGACAAAALRPGISVAARVGDSDNGKTYRRKQHLSGSSISRHGVRHGVSNVSAIGNAENIKNWQKAM